MVTKSALQYYLKFVALGALSALSLFFLLPALMLRPRELRNLEMFKPIARALSWLVGVRWTFRGWQHFAGRKGYITVSNHQSCVDFLGMFQMTDNTLGVVKKEILYWWPFGLAFWLCGFVFIDRSRTETAKNAINETAYMIKKNEANMWICPEGTRRNTGAIHPFKKGAFNIAINTQLPIIPVVFSEYYFLNDNDQRFDNGHVIASILPPVPTKGLTLADVDTLTETVRQRMIDEYVKITKEAKFETLDFK